ncbi:peptidoglycan DD-metalloendopeptidase family protein [Metabacillus sp. 84]|uniref:peptidoglycan DD-metalloendopeptidase family protein n=1 Tax=unclassified Metabacillus TaxID=2675274 RepID=UPI003CEC7623
MSRRADEIRRRMARRRKAKPSAEKADSPLIWKKEAFVEEEEKYTGILQSYEGGPDTLKEAGHPLFKPEVFLFKLFLSACLVLAMAVVFKDHTAKLDPVRGTVETALSQEFQFASVSAWYQKQFGHPLALFQAAPNEGVPEQLSPKTEFALPASGKVMENFKANGQGVLVETVQPAVKAMNEGIVIAADQQPDTGLTVVLQHADGSETWYGNLNAVDVALYDFVKMGKEVGTIKVNENKKGTYYFAIKQGGSFVDPNKVISFD